MKLFYAGLQTPEGRIRSTFADNVKHEAAAGMIEIESQELKELNDRVLESDGRRDARILGAEVDVYVGKDGSQLKALSSLTDITPSADTEIREIGMAEFINFIEVLKDTTGLYVDVIPASSGISQKALIELNKASSSQSGADMHSVNPPFIEMLKETLKLLYKGEHVSASWKN